MARQIKRKEKDEPKLLPVQFLLTDVPVIHRNGQLSSSLSLRDTAALVADAATLSLYRSVSLSPSLRSL